MPVSATVVEQPSLATKTPAGDDLVFMSGVCVVEWNPGGGGWSRDSCTWAFGPQWDEVTTATASAALAGCWNVQTGGVSIDDVRNFANNFNNNRMELTADLAVLSPAGLLRFSYQGTAVGTLAPVSGS